MSDFTESVKQAALKFGVSTLIAQKILSGMTDIDPESVHVRRMFEASQYMNSQKKEELNIEYPEIHHTTVFK